MKVIYDRIKLTNITGISSERPATLVQLGHEAVLLDVDLMLWECE